MYKASATRNEAQPTTHCRTQLYKHDLVFFSVPLPPSPSATAPPSSSLSLRHRQRPSLSLSRRPSLFLPGSTRLPGLGGTQRRRSQGGRICGKRGWICGAPEAEAGGSTARAAAALATTVGAQRRRERGRGRRGATAGLRPWRVSGGARPRWRTAALASRRRSAAAARGRVGERTTRGHGGRAGGARRGLQRTSSSTRWIRCRGHRSGLPRRRCELRRGGGGLPRGWARRAGGWAWRAYSRAFYFFI